MTPEEHEILRLEMRVLAQENLFDWIADVLRGQYQLLLPSVRSVGLKAIEVELARAKQEHLKVTIPHFHPAMSDLKTALFQEQFEELSAALLLRLAGPDQPKS